MPQSQPLAVFDIDGTIFRSNLLEELFHQLVRDEVFPSEVMQRVKELRTAWRTQRHSESHAAYIYHLVELYIRHIKGVRREAVEEAVSEIMSSANEKLYVYSREMIKRIQDSHFLVAISGSPGDLVTPFAHSLGFKVSRGSWFEVMGGRYTGVAIPGHLNKDQVLREFIEEFSLTLKGSIGVGDTEIDISMLELVEQPIAFNPNKELLAHASMQGWRVVLEHKDVIYHLDRDEAVLKIEDGFGHYYALR